MDKKNLRHSTKGKWNAVLVLIALDTIMDITMFVWNSLIISYMCAHLFSYYDIWNIVENWNFTEFSASKLQLLLDSLRDHMNTT